MAKQKDFNMFLSNIEPSNTTVSYISSVQQNLREYLASHPIYKDVHVQTFLSGSYAKKTSIRPKLFDGKRDVDIVVETSYGASHSSIEVINELFDILREKEVYCNAKIQSHSVGVELEGIDIDVVPIIKNDDGKEYCIGSSDSDEWIATDPKGHIDWSRVVNSDNEMKYKPLVKILKWWRRTNCPDNVKYPKGLALEKIIADNLADSDLNTEEYLIGTMKSIVDTYIPYINSKVKPVIVDPCITNNDLLENYNFSDFESFIVQLGAHLAIIDEEGPCNKTWRTVLGSEFPKDNSESTTESKDNGFRNTEEFIEDLFAINERYNLKIDCKVTQDGWRPFLLLAYLLTGGKLRHNKKLDFFIQNCNAPQPYTIYWKVRNVGEAAKSRDCIRGQIKMTDSEHHSESTSFDGPHFVECYIVKDGYCVARSRIDVPIGQC